MELLPGDRENLAIQTRGGPEKHEVTGWVLVSTCANCLQTVQFANNPSTEDVLQWIGHLEEQNLSV